MSLTWLVAAGLTTSPNTHTISVLLRELRGWPKSYHASPTWCIHVQPLPPSFEVWNSTVPSSSFFCSSKSTCTVCGHALTSRRGHKECRQLHVHCSCFYGPAQTGESIKDMCTCTHWDTLHAATCTMYVDSYQMYISAIWRKCTEATMMKGIRREKWPLQTLLALHLVVSCDGCVLLHVLGKAYLYHLVFSIGLHYVY